MYVYGGGHLRGHRLVFAFGLKDIAEAAGASPETVRKDIRRGRLDPSDLGKICAWISERAAQPAENLGPLADSFPVTAAARAYRRDELVAELRAGGVDAKPCAGDPRLLEVCGDRLTVPSAERVLTAVREQKLTKVQRQRVRQIIWGELVQDMPRELSQRGWLAKRTAAELEEALGMKVVARVLDTLSISGVGFSVAKAGELVIALKAHTPRAAELRKAILVLANYQAAVAEERATARARLKQRLLTAAGSG